MTSFELKYKSLEQKPQIHQLLTTFYFTLEQVFETLETSDIDMLKKHSIIEPIFNRNFGNNFRHQNLPNQRQRFHNITGKEYKCISFLIPSNSSIIYLNEDCSGFGFNNKGVREVLIQNDGK